MIIVVRYGGDVEWLLALTGADRCLELTDHLPDMSALRLRDAAHLSASRQPVQGHSAGEAIR